MIKNKPIKQLLLEKNATVSGLARKTKRSRIWVSKILNGRFYANPETNPTLELIARQLGMTKESLIDVIYHDDS